MQANAILNINLSQLVKNYTELKNIAKNSITGAVVKANAYGLGVEFISKKLYSAGCKYFFVATISEALEIRKFLADDTKIFVFNGIFNGEEESFFKHNITPILNDYYQLEIWAKYASKKSQKLNAVIHFDTGMNRLGFNYLDAEEIKNNKHLNGLNIDFVMSHLACASDKNHPQNQSQLEKFKFITKNFSDYKFSLANSNGIMNGGEFHYDITRPGYFLYANNVVTLKAKIIQIRDINEAGFVGYNSTYQVKNGDKIAVIPIGYADGLPRITSNKIYGYLEGYKLPQIGIISMDTSIFDVSKVPENILSKCSEIELINDKISVCDLAEKANTIGYEILIKLGNRLEKVYS